MDDCIFCRIIDGTAPAWKVLESDQALAFLDIHPLTDYHTLVVPKQHYDNVFDITQEALEGVLALSKAVVELYQQKLNLSNIQLLHNAGRYAQQEVFHFHLHLIPRHPGDGQNLRWRPTLRNNTSFEALIEALK